MSPSRRDFLALAPLALAGTPLAADLKKRPTSPFLQGNYAPVRDEVELADLKVVGKLPEGLDGTFARVGPNPQFRPIANYHWFDGDGMVHGLRLKGGKASYTNRYVRTAGWLEEKKAGKALYYGLADPPDLTKLIAGKDHIKNTANTALVWHNGRLLALWEGGVPHEVKLPALETAGPFTFGGKWKRPCTAHPKIDPATGELFFFGYQPVKPYVQYAVADRAGVIRHTASVDIPRPVMMHDFALTEKHAVFLDLPVTFDAFRTLRGGPPFAYEPKYGARLGLLPRKEKGARVRWFDVKPGYVFHVFNAHEDGDDTVLLGCRMNRFPKEITPPNLLTERQLKEEGPVPYRWRLGRKSGKVTEGPLDDVAADFPRINEARTGRQARYGYGMKLTMDALMKYDFEKGTSRKLELGKGRLGGEPVFAPRPGGKGEDDGWLMTFVYDQAAEKSELLIQDAADFAGKPVARVLLPRRVPFGFHGAWVPA